jgi:hypothetical protein
MMADIKQAAKWMEEGYAVQRNEFQDGPNDAYIWRDDTGITNLNLHELMFTLGDLLADDWQLAD